MTATTIVLAALALSLPAGTPRSAQDRSADAAELAKGRFLVASPDLRDPNFGRTVVLLLEHGPQGALGLIVNRPTRKHLKDWSTEGDELSELDDVVYFGGPVLPEHLLALVRTDSRPEHARRVLDEVFYSGDREHLGGLLKTRGNGATARAYAGHSGWGPGQLEWEVQQGGWLIVEADAASVFAADPEGLWDELIRQSTGQWA